MLANSKAGKKGEPERQTKKRRGKGYCNSREREYVREVSKIRR
jgi:hypothetical protein